MPQTVTGAAFVLGVILVIAALVGKDVKIAAVELPALEKRTRFIVGILGMLLIYVGLFDPLLQQNQALEQSSTVADLNPPGLVVPATPLTPIEPTSVPVAEMNGSYRVTGSAANGNPYTGILTLERRGSAYDLAWKTGSEFSGVGLQQGDILSVSYGAVGNKCSIISYRVMDDGTLDGQWLPIGGNILGSERDIPSDSVAPPSLAGTYSVTGVNPDGSSYKGELTVVTRNAAYQFVWKTGSSTYEGVGIRQGDVVSVAWGLEPCGVISYQIGAQRTLRGIWSTHGQYLIGTEDATRD